jgi:cyclopropane fatty-acyl-phospholipid synthase-like methyltransferase
MSDSKVYHYPQYYALGYRWNTEAECDFIEECLNTYGVAGGKRLLDIGCGSGRHLLNLAAQGYQVSGIDIRSEMIEFIRQQAKRLNLSVQADVEDLHTLDIEGPFDAAFCFMDTFRFLLTNDAILAHLRRVADLLVPGGLYLVDFWIPSQWDQAGNEIHQWEQTEGQTTVRVFYLQHPESMDPVSQTFEDELVFEVHEGELVTEIRGGRTRTRLIMPQEFQLLVEHAGAFELVGCFGDFDLTKPLAPPLTSWRMVSVLKKR